MEMLLRRTFWLVPLAVAGVCGALCIDILGSVSAEDEVHAATVPKTRERELPPPTKDAAAVSERNIFCSECTPPDSTPKKPPTAPAVDPSVPVKTTLPIVLLATSVSSDERASTATLMDTRKSFAGAYAMGESVPGGGPIVRVSPRFVDFQNAGRLERVELAMSTPPEPPQPKEPVAATGPIDMFAEGIKKVDDTHYEIDKELWAKVMADPNQLAKQGGRVGMAAGGFKIYGVRPNSVYARIGLQNGDQIVAINGRKVTSPDVALELYGQLKSASHLELQVSRRGGELTLEYGIR